MRRIADSVSPSARGSTAAWKPVIAPDSHQPRDALGDRRRRQADAAAQLGVREPRVLLELAEQAKVDVVVLPSIRSHCGWNSCDRPWDGRTRRAMLPGHAGSASRPTPTSSAARSSTTSARPSPCCCSCASRRSASPGCGSPPRRSCSRSGGGRGASLARIDRRTLLAWGAVLALMNCCFYLAIDRLPLATVAAIEFLPVVGLAALGARTPRNVAALAARGAGRVPADRGPARGRAARRRARVRQRRAVRALHRARAPRGAGRGRRRARRWRCWSPPSS